MFDEKEKFNKKIIFGKCLINDKSRRSRAPTTTQVRANQAPRNDFANELDSKTKLNRTNFQDRKRDSKTD